MAGAGTEQRRLAAIMFTDMVGYSSLVQQEETLALELLEEHRRLLRSLFPQFNGTEVKTIGDAFLVEFSSALEAARCAIEIQRTVAKYNTDATVGRQIHLRIGIHIGDVVHREGDVYGDGVNIASRIEPLATAGGICVSVDVERQIRNSIEVGLIKLGPTELKNIQMPIELFRLVLPWESPLRTGSGPKAAERQAARAQLTMAAMAVGVLLILGAAGWWFVFSESRTPGASEKARRESGQSSTAQRPKSVAVLPFVNMSSDQENEYLSDGLTEDLCTALAQVKELRVPARTSCFAFKGKTGDIRKIGELLRVATVLEGSVSKAGNKLRIAAQLINTADGYHLWSTNYDREISDLLQIRSDIAQQVVAALRVELGLEETRRLGKKPTENLGAYDHLLLGRYEFNRFTRQGLSNCMIHARAAIALDRDFADAYAMLGFAYNAAGNFCFVPPLEAFAQAEQAAQQALALDSQLAEAHVLRGGNALWFTWDWPTVQREFELAIKLKPGFSDAHLLYSFYLVAMGRLDEALTEVERARDLDPLQPIIHANLGGLYLVRGDYEKSLQFARKAAELDPKGSLSSPAIALALIQQKRAAEAVAEMERVKELEKDSMWLSYLGYVYAEAGQRADAERVLKVLQERRDAEFVSPTCVARVCLALGDTNQTIAWLERAYNERAGDLLNIRLEPPFDRLKGEPRYLALLRKMGIPAPL